MGWWDGLAERVEGRIGRRGQFCRDGGLAQVFVCGETDNARGANEHEAGRIRKKRRLNSPFIGGSAFRGGSGLTFAD